MFIKIFGKNLRIFQNVEIFEIFLSFHDYEEYLTEIITNKPMKVFFRSCFIDLDHFFEKNFACGAKTSDVQNIM